MPSYIIFYCEKCGSIRRGIYSHNLSREAQNDTKSFVEHPDPSNRCLNIGEYQHRYNQISDKTDCYAIWPKET